MAFLVLGLALLVAVTGCGGGQAQETTTTGAAATGTTAAADTTTTQPAVTLQAISFLPQNDPLAAVIPQWIDMVKKATGGSVTINWKGGPEIVPALEQSAAVRNGVVDIDFNVTAYYATEAPELSAFTLSQLQPWEERQNGFYDFMVERHNNIGLTYLGRWLGEQPFYLWVNKPVAKIDDLKGRSLRTRALYDRFMKALGITPVSVDQGEVYTALQRNIVEGFGWPLLGARASGWTEVTKNIIDIPFYGANNAVILMNPKSWDKLSDQQKAQVQKATADFEHYMVDYFKAENEKERAALVAAGVNFIKFSPEDTTKYLDTAYAVEWKDIETKVPDLVAKLKELTSK